MNGLKDIASFGKVEAEQDAILDYFVEMSIAENVDSNDTFLILGRKGSGKTALFRYFTEQRQVGYATALNLNGYP